MKIYKFKTKMQHFKAEPEFAAEAKRLRDKIEAKRAEHRIKNDPVPKPNQQVLQTTVLQEVPLPSDGGFPVWLPNDGGCCPNRYGCK